MLPGTVTSDTDLVAELIGNELGHLPEEASDDRDLERALATVLPRLEGAFSLVVMDEAHVIGVRDPNGFRPLCLGKLDHGWVLASESPALDIVGAHFVRELDPGEMVVIDATGPRSMRPFPDERVDPRLCLFEFVYFARPDTRLYNQSVHQARIRIGEQLAEQAPVEADMVMGVPESGVPAAEGFARRSGIPFGQGVVKNRYIGRSFIAPSQELRALGRAHEAEPAAREHRGQAHRRGRRLHRARHDAEAAHEDAPRGGRHGGAPAHHVAAGEVVLLLRHRHGRPHASCSPRRSPSTRSASTSTSTRSPTSTSTASSPPPARPAPGSATPASPAPTRCPCPSPCASTSSRMRPCVRAGTPVQTTID